MSEIIRANEIYKTYNTYNNQSILKKYTVFYK